MGGVAEAVARLGGAEADGALAVSVITQMELIAGCENKRELHILAEFLRRFRIVHLRPAASMRAVGLMEQFRLSHGLLMPDALIAATALDLELPFATKNQKHFRFIPDLHLLPYP